jgi:hypothetical protein
VELWCGDRRVGRMEARDRSHGENCAKRHKRCATGAREALPTGSGKATQPRARTLARSDLETACASDLSV